MNTTSSRMQDSGRGDADGHKPRQRLFIPGPTDVAPSVLAAQTAPMIGHRSDEFEALFADCTAKLKRLFATQSSVFTVASSGSGLQEAAIRNGVETTVVNFVNGAFSQRWHEVSLGCAKNARRVDIPWCTAVKPNQVAAALQSALCSGPVDAITVVHNETSTGVTSPVADIADTVRAISPETLVMVDAVSSFSGTEIPFDGWDLDLCLTSSQKALALPPGLAFVAVSPRLMERAPHVRGRGWYFDFVLLARYAARSTTPSTPAISLMRALQVQLDRIFAEGVEQRYRRHQHCAQRTQEWALAAGFGLMAETGFRSPTVTHVENRMDLDIGQLNAYLERQDMLISDGYGPYKGKAFRIAHMGEVAEDDLLRLFRAVDDFMANAG